MQNVPQIVRERLKATPPVVDHPDADALTAFAEHLLSDGERAIVLEHLARCGDCRDIVALALPEPDLAHAVSTQVRGGRLTWPALRWGFAAAGIVVIASFGILEYQHSTARSSQTMAVAKQSAQDNVTAETQSPPQTAANTSTRQPHKSLDVVQPSADALAAGAPAEPPEAKLLSRAAPPAVREPQSRGAAAGAIGGPAYGVHMPTQGQQQTATNQMRSFAPAAPLAKQQSSGSSSNLKIPTALQTVEVTAAAPSNIETSQAEARVQNQPVPLSSQPTEQLFDADAGARVDKAKPALNVAGRNVTQLVVLAPRWAVNSAGGLQRSFDQGNTWQDVEVTANAVPAAGASTMSALAKAPLAKEKDTDKKMLRVPASAPVFRAVAVNGHDVWAGGSQGMLYHSFDAGNHWTQVVPASATATLTGDIVGLEFTDAQHGKITTSTGQIWTTSDQGQTWQKE